MFPHAIPDHSVAQKTMLCAWAKSFSWPWFTSPAAAQQAVAVQRDPCVAGGAVLERDAGMLHVKLAW